MTNYLDLANLLESAAAALREAHAILLSAKCLEPRSLDGAKLSVRAFNILHNEGIDTLEALCAKSERELLEMRNCGPGVVKEIRAYVHSQWMSLKGEPRPS